MTITAYTNEIVEWDYISDKSYKEPFYNITLDVIISSDQKTWSVPTFWRGENRWSVRFIPPTSGSYKIKTRCSDSSNASLHNVEHTLRVETSPASPPKDLYIDLDKKVLKYSDDTAFLWLADTWWMGLSDRLAYPEDFHTLAQDRKKKGFNVIFLVAGLYPDMDAFDERGANANGFVWEKGFARINPAFFDEADRRIEHLVSKGFIPCIVGAWGYYLLKMGEEKMRRHWEYLIARWGAYPVIWCAAGEAAMPYYLSTSPAKDKEKQIQGWTEIIRFIRRRDPFKRLVTIHPTEMGREQIQDPNLLDFELLQASHNGYESIFRGVKLIEKSRKKEPKMPVIMGEINYEGIIHDTGAEMQRFAFWSSMLQGACGFTYGANGIWQVNTPEKPFGASPHGGCWGNTPWEEAMEQKGSYQIGLAKEFLQTLPWEDIQPKPEWIAPLKPSLDRDTPHIAGIEEKLRIVYFYGPVYPWAQHYRLLKLEAHIAYEAFFWDPRTAKRHPLGMVTATKKGEWDVPTLPTFEDWVLVLKATPASKNSISFQAKNKLKKRLFSSLKTILDSFRK